MRFILFISILFFLFSCKTELKKETTIEEIKSLMLKQEKCWNKGDLHCFMDSYWKSDSLSFIGKGGVNYGWQTTLDNYTKAYKNKSEMGTLSFENLSIKQLSSTYVYVVGKWLLKREETLGDLSGHYSLIWKNINSRWVIISDHSS